MTDSRTSPRPGPGFEQEDWAEVMRSIDRTWTELVGHQVELERRNAELEAMRGFLSSVLAAMSDVLVVCGAEGQVLEVNQAFLTLTGARREEMLGTDVVMAFAEAERPALKAACARLRDGGPVETAERQLLTAAGPAPIELSITARTDARRRFVGAVLIGRPVGELRRAYHEVTAAHEALKAAQTQLVHSEKLASLGRLVAGVAHELNNPISFVYGNAHALDRYTARFEAYFESVAAGASREELVKLRAELKLDQAVRKMRSAVSGALEGAERVRDIVESLRRLSAQGTGQVERFDLATTAETAALWVVKGRGATLPVAIRAEGPVMAAGRPGHVQQVVMNLVQNALDAMEGAASPDLTLTIRSEPGGAVCEVADRGPGIPADVAMRVFDPFFTTKPVGQGTGLGLSISYKIAEENGGRLSFAAREGGGTVFRLVLPVEVPDDPQA